MKNSKACCDIKAFDLSGNLFFLMLSWTWSVHVTMYHMHDKSHAEYPMRPVVQGEKACHWAVCKTIMFTFLKPIYIIIFYQVCSEPKENPPEQQSNQNSKYASKPIQPINIYNTQIVGSHILPLSILTTWKHRHKQFIQQTLHMGGSSNKQSNSSASQHTTASTHYVQASTNSRHLPGGREAVISGIAWSRTIV